MTWLWMPYRWGCGTSLSCLLRIIHWWLDRADGILGWWFRLWGRVAARCGLLHALPESQLWWLGFFLSLSSWGEGKNETWVTSDWNINCSNIPFRSCWYHKPSCIVPMIGLPLYQSIIVLSVNMFLCALLIRLPTLIYPKIILVIAKIFIS